MEEEANKKDQETLFDGDLHGLLEGAVQMHEMYLTLVKAGFKPSEALELIARMIANAKDEDEA